MKPFSFYNSQVFRIAMLTNKDTDTAAYIAGVIVAYYGILEDIKTRLMDFIPEVFVNVVKAVND